jgi:hypothetical protein
LIISEYQFWNNSGIGYSGIITELAFLELQRESKYFPGIIPKLLF